jgi:hypothetical protein
MEDTVKDPTIQKLNKATVSFHAARDEFNKLKQKMDRKAKEILSREGTGDETPVMDDVNLSANTIKKEKLSKAKNAAYIKMWRLQQILDISNEDKQGNEDEAKSKITKTASEKAPEKVFNEKNAERMARKMMEDSMNSFHKILKRGNEAKQGNEDEANAKRIKTDSEKEKHTKDEEKKRKADVKATQHAKKVAEATKKKEEQELGKQSFREERTRKKEKEESDKKLRRESKQEDKDNRKKDADDAKQQINKKEINGCDIKLGKGHSHPRENNPQT